jgi:hypothetical protein
MRELNPDLGGLEPGEVAEPIAEYDHPRHPSSLANASVEHLMRPPLE